MTRLLGYLVAGICTLLGLVLLGVLAVLLAANSEPGTSWLLRQALPYAPGEIEVEGIRGNLVDGFGADSVTWRLDPVMVEAGGLELRLGWLDLIEGRLVLRRAAATSLAVTIASSPPSEPSAGLPEVALPLELLLERLRVDQVRFQAAGFDETLSDVEARLQWQGTALTIRQSAATLRGVRAGLDGVLNLRDQWPLAAALEWRQVQGELGGAGEFRGDLAELGFTHELRLPQAVQLKGVVREPLTSPCIEVDAVFERLDLPSAASPLATLRQGVARASGRPDAYTLEASAGLATANAPDLAVELKGTGDLTGLDLSRLVVESTAGALTGSGRVVFAGPGADLELAGTGVNPGWWRADLPGALDFSARLRADGLSNLRLELRRLQGELLDQRVSGRGVLSRQGNEVRVDGLQLRAGDNSLEVNGQFLPSLAAAFEVEAPALGQLWPQLRGSLSGRGQAGGRLEAPRARLALTGSGLGFGDQAVGELKISGSIAADQTLSLELSAAGLRTGDALLGDLELRADGLVGAHRLMLALTGGPVDLRLESEGAWRETTLTERFATGVLEVPSVGGWTLRSPFDLAIGADGVLLGAHCWIQAASSFCLDDSGNRGGGLRVGGQLTDLPLALLQPLLGEGLELSGSADAQFRVQRDADETRLELDWRQRDTVLRLRESLNEVVETRLEDLSLRLDSNAELATVVGQLRGDYGVSADLSGTVTQPLSPDAGLDLRLLGTIPDLAQPTPLINRYVQLERLRGRVDIDLRIAGTRSAPQIQGGAELIDGFATVPQAGIDLEQIQLALTGSGSAPVKVQGSAVSGGGRLAVEGKLDWASSTGAYADLRFTGTDFQAIRLPDQSVFISPEVSAHIDDRRITLSGQVRVPRAEIRVQELPERATAPSGDIVVHLEVDESLPRRRRAPLEIVGSLEVTLGDQVFFSGFGLDTRLVGSLKLLQPPGGNTARAEGALRAVDGRFGSAGKALTIDRGVLVFSGPVNEPDVDVRATRSLRWDGRDYRVGVMLSGPVSAIQTQVFGEPAMSETDALSFLVLGRPASDLSGNASSELSSSAVALGLVRILPVTRQLEETLNLDEVTFEGGSGDDAAVVAGKRLNEDLFVRYKYGLFNRIGTFIVRYDVGRGFSIEAGSGQEQSLELIYSVDR